MDLDELRAFVAVVETGSLVAAARSARFARATLRRRIDELEARVGIPLLTRSGDGLVATAAGEILANRARSLLQDVGALLSAVRAVPSDEQVPSGLLRIVLPAGLPPTMVSGVTAALADRFPLLRVELHVAEDPLTALEDADLVFFFGDEDPSGAWSAHELMRVRLQLLASSTYLKTRSTPTTIAELSAHRIAAWREPGRQHDVLPLTDGTEVDFTPFFTSTDAHQLHQLARHDETMVLAPHSAQLEGLEEGTALVPVLPELIGLDVPICVAVPAALAEVPRVMAILDPLLSMMRVFAPPPG